MFNFCLLFFMAIYSHIVSKLMYVLVYHAMKTQDGQLCTVLQCNICLHWKLGEKTREARVQKKTKNKIRRRNGELDLNKESKKQKTEENTPI